MANIFLDTNYFIHLSESEQTATSELMADHQIFVSPLSVHVLYYVQKTKVPDPSSIKFLHEINIVDFTSDILERSLLGPTSDLEDNIQLHSAALANCDLFLTNDKKLLKMAHFGRTKITSSLS